MHPHVKLDRVAAALKAKGFNFQEISELPSPTELEHRLSSACQLWVISSSYNRLERTHLKVIRKFFDDGGGLYLWGDNQPLFAEANFIAHALVGCQLTGDYPGGKNVEQRPPNRDFGPGFIRHFVMTGINQIFEGITIAAVTPAPQTIFPIVYGSAGNVVVAGYDQNGKRLLIDGGFTRLYNEWDTAATERYVTNAAVWLVNVDGDW
eukprot:c4757_g1_i1.p1 GENE.c4757_g1_i1~~c4757_g1_i1.p1  ORF type:complete len:207 (+),score=48.60 c4757_g1_i1:737-1357(+)